MGSWLSMRINKQQISPYQASADVAAAVGYALLPAVGHV